VSMTGTSIFAERDDLMDPEFAKVLKGYDPMEVDAFVFEAKARIEELERDIRTMRDERDVARRQFTDVADDVYRDIAERMADVIAAADKQAHKMLDEAEREATALMATTERQAEDVVRKAETEVERLRRQGEERVRQANAEVDRLLGGLMLRRDDIVAELGLVRQRTLGVVEKIDAAISVSSVPPRVPEASNGDGQAQPARSQIVKIEAEDQVDAEDALPFDNGLEPF
jgi:cell division septum initiation protein DivIVA